MIQPLRDLLYILPLRDRKEIGSIILPEQAEQLIDQGIVKYRGPKTTGEIRRGDHVIFSGWSGSHIITEDDGLLIVIPEDFIVGLHKDDKRAYFFTEEHFNRMIESSVDKTYYVFGTEHKQVIEYIREVLKAEIRSSFFQELHF